MHKVTPLHATAVSNGVKTLLINVFDYAVLKNVFMPRFSAVFAAARETRCIVLIPASKREEFSELLTPLGFEVIARPQKYASFWETAALFAARNSIPTHTTRQLQEEGIDGSGRLPLIKYVCARILWIFGHSYVYRALLKKFLLLFFDAHLYDEILIQHKPDLVVATSTYAVDDIRLLKASRTRRIPTIGMTKSWDNLTSKDALLVPPDHLLVHNDVVAAEASFFHRYPRDRITVVGVPQFDWYADPSFMLSREEFFSRMGLDPRKKLITYTAMGVWLVKHERDIIRTLYRLVREKRLSQQSQLLVRFHPAYPDEKRILQTEFPGLVVDQPGVPEGEERDAWKADWRFSTDDVRQLASTLQHSDVVLNCGSTIILDTACFDTPMIGIAFDGDARERSYWASAARLFERDHCKKVLETGGVRIVHTEEELVKALDSYLDDPSLDSVGRGKIVAQQAGSLGKASEHLARAILLTAETETT